MLDLASPLPLAMPVRVLVPCVMREELLMMVPSACGNQGDKALQRWRLGGLKGARHDAQHGHLPCLTRAQAQTHASDNPTTSCSDKPNHISDSGNMYDMGSWLSVHAQSLHRAPCNGHLSVDIKFSPHRSGCRMCGRIYRHAGPDGHCSRHTAADPLSSGISLHAVLVFEALALSSLS